jgi:polar amino acid transport system substrate-binding protein
VQIGRVKQQTRSWTLGLLGLAAGFLLSFPLAAQDKRTIRIAMEGASPPFNYLDQSHQLQGFEPDLAQALCEAMQAQCILVAHEWDGIIRDLINREYDAIMSSMAVTERRLKRIAFSRRYFLMPSSLLTLRDGTVTEATPKALAGKRIGITDRRDHVALIEGRFKGAEARVYGKVDDAILDLRAERIDAVIADKLSLTRYLEGRDGECCRLLADVPPHPGHDGRPVAVGLRREDEDLKALFDAAIATIQANGTYDRIRAKYFPFDVR